MSVDLRALEALGDIEVDVCAGLGSARVPLGAAAAFAEGTVVSLDCAADAPVMLLVNGVPIATGELVVNEDGLLAVVIGRVAP